ncbi:hypothetical protein [Enterobacter hormaechei]|uniref:hypothetical protein n=1 Tax=Enterobacter hormaechei TaxID=158836 RepID=UPI0007A763D4|nr:hypothetical protein [Enterobacter hormaechei]
MITHAIIKQKYRETVEKRQERKAELQDVAAKLLQKYKDSLSLPSEAWLDAGGIPRTYVTTGIRNERGLYQQKSLSSLTTDDNHSLTFIISTTLDELEGGNIASAEVAISIYKESGSYYVLVGNERRSFRVVTINAADAFDNVCDAIKSTVLSCFADERLDW